MKHLFLVGLLLTLLSGCIMVPPYDDADYGKNADGKTNLRDTARTWKYLTREIDEGINLELMGKPPGGGFRSWNEARVHGVQHFRSSGEIENPEKYIAYLIEQRRKVGLPEIVFPAPEKTPK